jgi:GTP cyclohydrolase II
MRSPEVKRLACARIPTALGRFELCLYSSSSDDQQHLALVMGEIQQSDDVLVRVHSECFTGEVLRSQRCDCGPQLDRALQAIGREGRGVLVYLRQEGRGIGLLDKLRAYNLQDQGYDTVEANLLLGHGPDERDYGVAAAILRELKVRSVRLLTNNPEKVEALVRAGIPVAQRLGLQADRTAENAGYLETKARRLHHLLALPHPEEEEQAARLPDAGRDGRPA